MNTEIYSCIETNSGVIFTQDKDSDGSASRFDRTKNNLHMWIFSCYQLLNDIHMHLIK